MKKYLILSLAALAALVSCQKEVVNNNPASNGPVTFSASIADSDTKATIDYNSSGAKIFWELHDRITITDVATSETGVYEVTDGAGTKKAILSFAGEGTDFDGAGEYTAVFGTAPSASQNYSSSNPTHTDIYMTASTPSKSDNICFTAQCGVLKLSLQSAGKSITKVEISDGTNLYALNMDAAVDISSEKVFYWSLPAGSYTRMYIYDNTGKLAVKPLSTPLAITAGRLQPASTSTLSFDAIAGAFTVNSSGKKVHFAKGNLQYQASTSIWRFAENQYDYIGSDNANTSSSYSGWIDLFGWGATGMKSINSNLTYPYNTSTTPEDYKTVATASEEETLTRTNGGDWGVCMGEDWRTLTGGDTKTYEWWWLLGPTSATPNPGTNCRTSSTVGGTENARYARVKVNGVCGLLIFPDVFVWTSSMGTAPSNCNIKTTTWDSVPTYTTTEFSAMESAGCVFLPATGMRGGTDLYDSTTYYWSSSVKSTTASYALSISNSTINPKIYPARYYGSAVRLVTE